MSFQFCTSLDWFLEIPLEVTRKLNAVLLPRVGQLSVMVDHNRLTIEQRAKVFVFFAETKSVTATERRFRAVFHTRWAPAGNTILHLYCKFEEEGSVKEEKRPWAPAVHSLENVETLRLAMQRSPGKSTRKASRELGISRHLIQRILHSDLKLFLYKISVLHRLSEHDKERRLQFAAWAKEKNATFHNTWFSDEVCFHLDGNVNKQNVCFWAREHPHNFRERCSHRRKVTVWVAISSHSLIGPIFFSETVNSQQYLHMLQNDFLPQLMVTQLPIGTQWFMQDGATPHTANVVLNFLNTIFSPHIMLHHYSQGHNCGHFWPPLSPDLNPCGFFLWGFLKEKMFPMKPLNVTEMRAMIIQLCNEIDEDMRCWIITNMRVRLQEVVRQNGGHIEQVLSKVLKTKIYKLCVM
jgi:hypothetical protein